MLLTEKPIIMFGRDGRVKLEPRMARYFLKLKGECSAKGSSAPSRCFELLQLTAFSAHLFLVLSPTEPEGCAVLCLILPLSFEAIEFKSIFEGKTKTASVF